MNLDSKDASVIFKWILTIEIEYGCGKKILDAFSESELLIIKKVYSLLSSDDKSSLIDDYRIYMYLEGKIKREDIDWVYENSDEEIE